MLFTDSDVVTLADLLEIDSEAQIAAQKASPAITLEGDRSVCRHAWQECGNQILSAMQMYSTYLAQPGMTSGHVAAVQNVGVPTRTQPRARLNQIVANDYSFGASSSAIEHWASFMALYILYRNASGRLEKNDRYEKKMTRFWQEASDAWAELRHTGLPMVYKPLECPGALHGFNPGTWGSANVSVSGGTGTAVKFDVAITYYDASVYTSLTSKGNGESAPSTIVTANVPPGGTIEIDISSLVPPTGAPDPTGTSLGTWVPLTATHWNVYAGPNGGTLWYQGSSPIATKTYSLETVLTSGTPLQAGQYSDVNIVFQNVVMRG